MTEVSAAILRQDGKILVCQRREGGNCSLLWEFPGGKREAGETMEQCAVRECREELELEIDLQGLFAKESYRYGDEPFQFAFYRAAIRSGSLKKKVHQEIRWVKPRELSEYPFCPADREIVRRLAEEKPLLRAMHHVAVIVSDYQKSKEFYLEKLGLEMIRENYRADRGSYKLDLQIGDCELELFSFPDSPARLTRPEACGLRHLAFRVENIRAAAAELERRGILVEPVRVDAYTGQEYTFFMDPDGLPLELKPL